jgi:hypothetical protein
VFFCAPPFVSAHPSKISITNPGGFGFQSNPGGFGSLVKYPALVLHYFGALLLLLLRFSA